MGGQERVDDEKLYDKEVGSKRKIGKLDNRLKEVCGRVEDSQGRRWGMKGEGGKGEGGGEERMREREEERSGGGREEKRSEGGDEKLCEKGVGSKRKTG